MNSSDKGPVSKRLKSHHNPQDTIDKVRPGDDVWMARLHVRFKQYLKWLPPYFKCFCDLLPPDIGVNIMSDDGLETKEIAMHYLTSRHRAFIDHTDPPRSESRDDGDDGLTSS